MDVGARNRLLECSDCHALYHQECHTPVVTSQESDENWVCHNCKVIICFFTSQSTSMLIEAEGNSVYCNCADEIPVNAYL